MWLPSGEGFVQTPLGFFFFKRATCILLMWMCVMPVEILDLLELVVGGVSVNGL